jgi:hypothetical protein
MPQAVRRLLQGETQCVWCLRRSDCNEDMACSHVVPKRAWLGLRSIVVQLKPSAPRASVQPDERVLRVDVSSSCFLIFVFNLTCQLFRVSLQSSRRQRALFASAAAGCCGELTSMSMAGVRPYVHRQGASSLRAVWLPLYVALASAGSLASRAGAATGSRQQLNAPVTAAPVHTYNEDLASYHQRCKPEHVRRRVRARCARPVSVLIWRRREKSSSPACPLACPWLAGVTVSEEQIHSRFNSYVQRDYAGDVRQPSNVVQFHISTHQDPTKMTVMWMTRHHSCQSLVLFMEMLPEGLPSAMASNVTSGDDSLIRLESVAGTYLGHFKPSQVGQVTSLGVRFRACWHL